MTILKRVLLCLGLITLLSVPLTVLLIPTISLPKITWSEEAMFGVTIFEGMVVLSGVGYFIEKLVTLRRLLLRRQATSIIYTSQPKAFFLGGIEPNLEELMKISVAFGLAVMALPIYATSIFPLLPQIAGGGKPQMVSIIIKTENATVLRNFKELQSDLGIGCKPMIRRVFLLADQSDGYVVTNSERGAQINLAKSSFKIPKEAVELIVQHPMTF